METIDFKASFEQSPSLVIMMDLNFIILSASDAYLKVTQTIREQIVGRDLFEVFPDNPSDALADGVRNIRDSLNRVIKSKIAEKLAVVKYDIPRPEFEGGGFMQKYWQPIHTPVLDQFNEVKYVLQYVEDVTANEILIAQLALEKKLLQQVSESEKRYSLLLMKSPFAIAVLKGKEMVITLANDKIKNIWGKGNDVEGKKLFNILPEFSATEFPSLLNEVYTTGTPFYGNELLYLTQLEGITEESYFNFIYQPYLEADESISGVTVIVYEVTEMVVARKKIEESKLRFQCAVEALQGFLWTNNPAGEMEGDQPGWALLTGQSKEAYQGFGWANAIHPEDKEATLQAWLTAIQTKRKFVFEHCLKMRDGSWGQFSINAIPLFNPDGSVLEWVGVHTDITKQRKAEEALKESEQRFKQLVDLIPQKIFQSDANGEVFFYNYQWYKDTGLSFKDLKGRGWEKIIHPDDIVESRKNLESALGSGNMVEMENRILNKEGQYRWHLNRAVAIKNKEGEIMIWVGSNTDIHAQKEQKEMLETAVNDRTRALDEANRILLGQKLEQERRAENSIILSNHLKIQQELLTHANLLLVAQEEKVQVINQQLSLLNINLEERVARRTRDLAESEQRFRTMMETIPQIAWTNTVDLEVNFFNQRWYDYTGLDFNQGQRLGWQKVVHPDDLKDTFLQFNTILKTIKGGGFQTRLQSSDAKYRWHLIQLKPIKDEAGKMQLWVGTATDIQELKLLQQQKDDFISIASHELKTPVTSLKISLQLLNEMKESLALPMVANLITLSNKSLDKFTILIDDLLNASKVNEGQLHLQKTLINLSKAIGNCCNHVQLAGKYTLKFEGNMEVEVFADGERIMQIIVNFVNNSMKYAPDTKEIRIIIEKINEIVKVSVIDEGPGIEPEKIPYLFERYYQVQRNGTKYSTGLGLGLYIASEIVKKHGGQIGVDSEVGKGSTFWFTLPL